VVRGEEIALRSAIEPLGDVEVVSVAPLEDGVVRVRLRAATDRREDIARAVVGAELGLVSLSRVSTGLEGIFVSLSRGGEAAS